MNLSCSTLWVAGFACLAGSLEAQGMVRGELILGASHSEFRREAWYVPTPGRPSSERWEIRQSGSVLRPMLGVGASLQLLGPVWARAEAVAVTRGYVEERVSRRSLFLEVPLLVEVLLPWKHGVNLRGVAGVAPSAEVSCSAHRQLPYGGMRWIGPPVQLPVACGDGRERTDVGRVYGAGFGPFVFAGFLVTPELRVVQGRLQGSGADASTPPVQGEERSRYRTWSLTWSVSR